MTTPGPTTTNGQAFRVRLRRVGLPVLVAGAVLLGVKLMAPAPRGAVASEGSPSDPALPVPTAHAALGTVHHSLPGRDRQVAFLSDTPLETIHGRSNEVHGYLVLDAEGAPAAGAWRLPVASLRTGLPTRDRHILRPEWLDAGAHPFVRFDLERVEDVRPVDDPAAPSTGARTIRCTLIGTLEIRGIARPLRVTDATITTLPPDRTPHAPVHGALALVRGGFEVHLADFGITHPMITDRRKVAPDLRLDLTLVHSTVAPEEQPGGPALATRERAP